MYLGLPVLEMIITTPAPCRICLGRDLYRHTDPGLRGHEPGDLACITCHPPAESASIERVTLPEPSTPEAFRHELAEGLAEKERILADLATQEANAAWLQRGRRTAIEAYRALQRPISIYDVLDVIGEPPETVSRNAMGSLFRGGWIASGLQKSPRFVRHGSVVQTWRLP